MNKKLIKILSIIGFGLTVSGVNAQQAPIAPQLASANNTIKSLPISLEEIQNKLIKENNCQFNCNNLIETKIKSFKKDKKEIDFEFNVNAEKTSIAILPFKVSDIDWSEIKLNNKEWNNTTIINGFIGVVVNEGKNLINLKGTLNKNSSKIILERELKSFTDESGNGFKIIESNEQKILVLDENKVNVEKNQIRNAIIFGDKTLLSVTRELNLSDRWKLRTIVEPISFNKEKVETIEIELLKGEKPLNDVVVKDGKVVLEISKNRTIMWDSDIEISNELNIKAINNVINRVTINNMNDWVYQVNQRNPINTMVVNRNQDIKSWLIYDNENLNLKLNLPKAIPGNQTQIKNYNFERTVNNNLINNKIKIEIISTLGGQYEIELPNEDFKLRAVNINGIEKNIDKKNNMLLVNINRGTNNIEIIADSEERSIFSRFPELKFKDTVYNAYYEWKNEQRWIIWAGSGDSKPSVLIWGILLTLLGLSYLLSKNKNIPLTIGSWFLLFIGLTQSNLVLLLLTIGWFFAFSYREKFDITKIENEKEIFRFKLMQIGLVVLTFIVIANLIATIGNGLLERPEMYLTGMNVYSGQLAWYMQELYSTPYIISLPLWVYKLLMFIWSFWLAFKLVEWMKWMWNSYAKNGYWIKVEKPKKIKEEVSEQLNEEMK